MDYNRGRCSWDTASYFNYHRLLEGKVFCHMTYAYFRPIYLHCSTGVYSFLHKNLAIRIVMTGISESSSFHQLYLFSN